MVCFKNDVSFLPPISPSVVREEATAVPKCARKYKRLVARLLCESSLDKSDEKVWKSECGGGEFFPTSLICSQYALRVWLLCVARLLVGLIPVCNGIHIHILAARKIP